jgi:hypothetical protein
MRNKILTVLCLVLLAGCMDDPSGWPRETFSPAAWSRKAEGERYALTLDLRDSHLLVGKTSVEVKKILGNPGFESSQEHYMTYIVKTGGPSFNQVYIVDIRMNDAGVVQNVIIRGD